MENTQQIKATKWEEVRASWVNGQKSQAVTQLLAGTKKDVLGAIHEAVFTSYQRRHQTGDLVDLMEILNFIKKYR